MLRMKRYRGCYREPSQLVNTPSWTNSAGFLDLEDEKMNVLSDILLAVAIGSVLWGVASAVLIAEALRKRGVKVNWIFLRFLILSTYLGQYRDITRHETGRPGPLFYSYVIAMNLAFVTAIAGIVLRAK